MEFLVRQRNRMERTAEMQELRAQLIPLERIRAKELREAGILRKLWRVPGSQDSIALYETPDATSLHDVLSSLPMFPYVEFDVQPLATHPQERGVTLC